MEENKEKLQDIKEESEEQPDAERAAETIADTDPDDSALDFSPAEEALLFSEQETLAAEDKTPVSFDETELSEEAVAEPAEVIAEEPAPKKKRTLQFTILVSAAIVLAVILVAVVCRLFLFQGLLNTDLLGNPKTTTWHYRPTVSDTAATVDEASIPDYYFVFEPDGKVTIEMASFENQGTYVVQNLEEADLAAIQSEDVKAGTPVLLIENTNMADGKFLFDREGNVFTGSKLILTSLSSTTVKLELDAQEPKEVAIEREGEFTKDENLLGNWSYRDEVGTQTFTFNDDGTYVVTTKSQGIIQRQKGIYNCKDGTFTIYYSTPTAEQNTFKYTITDNKLSLTLVAEYLGQTYEQPIGEFTKDE